MHAWVSSVDLVIRAEHGCAYYHLSDTVWVAVWRRTPILQISTAILADLAWNADRCSTVCNSSWEVMNAAGLMVASQTSFIVKTATWVICTNVTHMLFAHLLNCIFYCSNDTSTTSTDNTPTDRPTSNNRTQRMPSWVGHFKRVTPYWSHSQKYNWR